MEVSRVDMSRWVIQHIDQYTVRCVKELAIRHNLPIAQVVEVAVYRLYASPEPLKGLKRKEGYRGKPD